MKNRILHIVTILLLGLIVGFSTNEAHAQRKKNVMNQNISIYAEDEALAKVIEQICDQFNLNYSYNSKILEGKQVNLNIVNKPLKSVLEKLMKDYYLIFEIENNILVVRDYVPMDKSSDNAQSKFTAPNLGFFANDLKKREHTIKFKSASNLIIISVQVNESDTLNFILDSGVRHPIITELPYINKLNLKYMRPIEVRGLGGGEPLTAYRSGNNEIQIAGFSAKNQDIQMIINEDFQVSQILGIPVHGLIGFNMFNNYIVKVDYPNEKLHIIKPDKFKYKPRSKDIVLPITFEGYKPYITTSIVQDDLSEVRVKLLVDTGASDALWLATSTNEKLKLPDNHISSFLGKGLSGNLYGAKGRVTGVNLGSTVLFDPIVSFPDTSVTNHIVFKNNRNGTIGAEILRRFYVTFDYPNKRLILRPNQHIKEKFNYNMSGLEIINPMPGFPIYTVSEVREGSPAFLAGIRTADQIITVNNSSHKHITLNDINMLMQSKENKKIKMTVLRNGEKIKTSFLLKKEL
ncbi:PDZ domain-containing protein [Puteibacter caeruleilacunae]|nr:PDZ domain-containing protein [Puteibacter caeruleilacunae]